MQYSRLAVSALLFALAIAAATVEPAFSGMSYLDNGEIRIGVDLDIGGAITYLSESGSDENMINSHDWGRQIQMSFYSGPVPYIPPSGKQPAKNWTFIGWNPIQSGDAFDNPSKVIAHTNSGTELYVKCIPMHWPLDNEPGECTFETWLTLEGNTVRARSRINNARGDETQYPARGQELPAVYTNGTYYRLFTYDGDAPFTGAPVRRIEKVWDTRIPPAEAPGGPWDNWYATENWSALVREDGFGVGVWTPNTYTYTGGFAGVPGSGGPKDGPTGYISPTRREILDHNIEYTYTYTLIVGQLEEIRKYVYENTPGHALPDYTFARDRESWTLADARDAGWPLDGAWRVTLAGENPRLIGPDGFWKASDLPAIQIRAAFDTGGTSATLRWRGFQGEGGGAVAFDVIPDGEPRTYTVDLAGATGYGGIVTQFTIAPETDGAEGRSVTLWRVGAPE
ncbi:MAG: hypothetical protein KF886_01185 [Candidatus Hydrogenedentes bacterium]|nr:hypothetical protein [Candidatus Hydrogenedentota bacterium]